MSVEIGSIADYLNVFLTGIITFFVYRYTKKQSDAQMEIAVREMISSARSNLRQIIITDTSVKEALLNEAKAKEALLNEAKAKEALLNEAKEELLNAYDEACAKYIDKKIDKKRFKRMYYGEIKNIVKDNEFQKMINWPKSKFPHIVKICQEWNSEK